jgi:hypothetical protein
MRNALAINHLLLPAVVESARVDWEVALNKFLRAKKTSKSALESPAMDAVMCLSRLELSRFDLISRLNLLEMNKRLELIERVCTALYSARAYFHQCNEVIAELEPSMQSMLVSVQAARDTETHKTKEWDSLRTTLHVDVSTAVANVVSSLSGLGGPVSTPITGTAIASLQHYLIACLRRHPRQSDDVVAASRRRPCYFLAGFTQLCRVTVCCPCCWWHWLHRAW